MKRQLLLACPEGKTLRVCAFVPRLTGWGLARSETLALPAEELQSEVIASALRPLVLRWSVSPGTEIALLLPPVAGGLLSLEPRDGRNSADPAALETQLSTRIPYPLGEIVYERWSARGVAKRDQFAWAPRALALEFRNAFARLGLVLGEIVFRAQVFAADLAAQQSTRLVVEEWGGWCCVHACAGGRVARSSALRAETAKEFASRVQFELLALESEGIPAAKVVLAAPEGDFSAELAGALKEQVRELGIERVRTDIAERFIRFWNQGSTGIWVVPEQPETIGRLRRLALLIAICGLGLAAGLAWHEKSVSDDLAALRAREARLRPQAQSLQEKEREAVRLIASADAVARASQPPAEVQGALLAVFNALPKTAWVTRFAIEQDRATVAGRGLDAGAVVTQLKSQPSVSSAADAGREESGADATAKAAQFRVSFRFGADSPAPRADTQPRKGQP